MSTFYTPGGVRLPDDADPVHDGAARIRDVGQALDAAWTLLALSSLWVAQPAYPPQWRVVAGRFYLCGTASLVASTWNGAASSLFTLAAAAPPVAGGASAPIGLVSVPAVMTSLANPANARQAWLSVRWDGAVLAYAPATPADAIVLNLDGLSWSCVVVSPDDGSGG